MGFLGKSNKARNRNNHTSIVAEGTHFSGQLTLDAKLHIDGRLEGAIQSTEDVSVGVTGFVEADVRARNVVICGHLKGNVECDHIEVLASGTLIGSVVSNEFVVEPGARFDGENHVRGSKKTPSSPQSVQPIPLQMRLAQDRGGKSS